MDRTDLSLSSPLSQVLHPAPAARALVRSTAAGWRQGGVLVLVGTSGSGKTTLRRRLVSDGLHPDSVVSLDDLRRRARARDVASGHPPRPLQDYSAVAVRHGARRAHALAAFGAGYLADATHLRRPERRAHLSTAADTGLTARAILLPLPSMDELLRRDAARPVDAQVPAEVLERQAQRRSLISAAGLLGEGFDHVVEVTGDGGVVHHGSTPGLV